MTTQADRLELFERWAAEYDASVLGDGEDGFPFAGYEQVLDAVVADVNGDVYDSGGSSRYRRYRLPDG